MARNTVQFQKGLSEPEFDRNYGTEQQCRDVVIASRWPQGFQCPGCGSQRHSVVTTRDLFQCSDCRLQTSPGPSSPRPSCRCAPGSAHSIT